MNKSAVEIEQERIAKLEHIPLSELTRQGSVTSIGIFIPYGGIEDQTNDEKTLIKLISLIRKENPETKINVTPYIPHESDREAKYEKVGKVVEANQLIFSIAFDGLEVVVYSFEHNRKMNGSFLDLTIPKKKSPCVH